MLKLALQGLLIVAVAGILAAAIFVAAKVIGMLILIIFFVGALWLVLHLLFTLGFKDGG